MHSSLKYAAAALALLALPAAAQQAPKLVAIKAGRLVDTLTSQVRTDQVIIVEGERIRSVGPAPSTPIPAGASVIDLSGETVLPGLIDSHVHLDSDPTVSYLDSYHVSAPRLGVFGAMNARRELLAGFTTVRDVGSAFYADVAIRDGIDRGDIPGPHVFAAGPMICITGGHCDDNNLAPEYNYASEGTADGPDAVRHAVRVHIKYGADLIKYAGTGGVFSKGDTPGGPQFSFEEAKTMVDEAHFMGRTVAVHAHGAEGIKIAIRAGADSIEHASLVDDEGIRLAKEHGTYFSMDIYNTDYTQSEGKKNGVPEENLKKDRDIGEIQRENFEKAVKAGVKMLFGTDAGVYPHGMNAKQFATMVRYGMTPMQAIVAATENGADVLKKQRDFGAIAAGRYANIVAVDGDPLKDVTALERMHFVMKDGAVYRGTAKECAASPATWACEPPAQ